MQTKRQIQSNAQLTIGLSWDEVKGKELDLDLQCVMLNELGQIEDAVFYNQYSSKCGSVQLSGDSQGEKEGFDEMLTVNFEKVTFVCSYKGQPFQNAESANIQALVNQAPLSLVSVGGQVDSLSFLPYVIEKHFDGTWWFNEVSFQGQGKSFIECEQIIKKGIISCGFDEGLLQECKNWTGGKSFQIKKDSLMIPPSMKQVFVGLGWDTKCDIDSSILLYDVNGVLKENIFYGNKKSQNGSIIHHGDNLTGSGSGDDEVITINLDKVDESVKCIWSVITIFTNGMQFDDVDGAYCRLVDPVSKKEFCKFNLSKNKDGISTGNIMCCLTRFKEGSWGISPKGYYVTKTKRSEDVVPIISEVIKNKLSRVIILEDKSKPKHTHEVTVIKGQGLASFDSNGFSDPFVVIKVNGKEVGKTRTIKKNLNPEWNEVFNITIRKNDKIEFILNDYDRFTTNDFMGTNQIIVDDNLLNSYNHDQTLKVLDKTLTQNPKFTGELFLKFKRL